MAFSVDCVMQGYKVLGVQSGTSKAGKPYRVVNVFKDGRSADVSCSDAALFGSIDALREMDCLDLPVRCVAGRERSYIILTAQPVYSLSADGTGYGA